MKIEKAYIPRFVYAFQTTKKHILVQSCVRHFNYVVVNCEFVNSVVVTKIRSTEEFEYNKRDSRLDDWFQHRFGQIKRRREL